MTLLLQAAIVSAALVFVAVSGTMNALFLSSLGRTPVEVGLLAAVSIASDITKAALPVILARAIMLRAVGQTLAVAVLLTFVVVLSLASGTGFTAMTRSSVTSAQDAQQHQLARLQTELNEIDRQIEALSKRIKRPSPLIGAGRHRNFAQTSTEHRCASFVVMF
jgi:hypothetical protein